METKDASKRMNKEDRRKQILNAAMAVFTEKGFIGSTTLEIAKAAGVSEVTLFRYFSSKQEMFLAGIEPILFSTLEGSINTSVELSSEAKLEYILYERISFISSNYKVVKLILTEAPLLSELGRESFMKRILQILETMLLQIGVSVKDKEFTLRLLMGSILSFLYMPEADEKMIKEYVGKMAALILQDKNKT
ncbi:MAG: TetR/AcrR family transcriptional regulator [Clostridiales bacterium]|nr:TetR/AcrR family transcriptional regulator [Clostridiales bacterium]